MSELFKFKPARLWIACEGTGTGVSTGGRVHSPRVQVFVANAWICAPRATDRDPQSFNVNAWICAQRAADRDLESFCERLDMHLSGNRP